MKHISFYATQEVDDYIKLLSVNNSLSLRPVKTLSALINKVILEHKDAAKGIKDGR